MTPKERKTIKQKLTRLLHLRDSVFGTNGMSFILRDEAPSEISSKYVNVADDEDGGILSEYITHIELEMHKHNWAGVMVDCNFLYKQLKMKQKKA